MMDDHKTCCRYPFIIYESKIILLYIETYTVLFVNYITIGLEDKKQKKKKKTDPDILLRQRNTFILLIKI